MRRKFLVMFLVCLFTIIWNLVDFQPIPYINKFGPTESTAQTVADRDPALWPFSTMSVWNYPIGANAHYNAAAQDGFGKTFAQQAAANNTMFFNADTAPTTPFQTLYIGTLSDPLLPLCYWGNFGGGAFTNYGVTGTLVFNSVTYNYTNFPRHIARSLPISNGNDKGYFMYFTPDHLTIMSIESVLYTSGTDYCGNNGGSYYGQWQGNNGEVNTDAKGPGIWVGQAGGLMGIIYTTGDEASPANIIGLTNGQQITSGGQGPAARFSFPAGRIRAGETHNGINHALFFSTLTGVLNGSGSAPGGHAYVWPANAADCSPPTCYTAAGVFYIGSLIAIPSSVNLAAHTFNTIQGQNIAYAMQRYGAYYGDTGGGYMTQNVDQSLTTCSVASTPGCDIPVGDTNFAADTTWIISQLALVTNSFNPTNGGAPRGGWKLDGGDGNINTALLAPHFAQLYGGGNGRASYFVPYIPRSIWAWITSGVLW